MNETAQKRIYILGGLPRTGKSTLGKRLVHEFMIDALETDQLRMLFNADPTSAFSYRANATIEACTQHMRPYLEALIAGTVHSAASLVLSGETIDPCMIAESPHRTRMAACFFGLNNPDAAYSRIRSGHDPRDWANRLDDLQLRSVLNRYADRSLQLEARCLTLGLPYFDSSKDIGCAERAAYDYLCLGTFTVKALGYEELA